jgi:luciferase family oxidoreductase group 1
VFELRAWLADQPLQPGHPFAPLKANPRGPTTPEMWILGSSDYGAHLAAHFGLPYAFAYFFTDGQGVEQALDIYRSNYKPSERHPEPQATICVWALAADTEEEAWRLARTRQHSRVERERGLRRALQSPESLERYDYTHIEKMALERFRSKACVGTADQVAAKLDALATSLALDELVVVTWTYDPEPRHRSYELLARAFNL